MGAAKWLAEQVNDVTFMYEETDVAVGADVVKPGMPSLWKHVEGEIEATDDADVDAAAAVAKGHAAQVLEDRDTWLMGANIATAVDKLQRCIDDHNWANAMKMVETTTDVKDIGAFSAVPENTGAGGEPWLVATQPFIGRFGPSAWPIPGFACLITTVGQMRCDIAVLLAPSVVILP